MIQVDETPLQVLREKGRTPQQKSYFWLFRRHDPERPVLIYQYHPTRAGTVANDFLADFQGTVQTDGYAGYDFLDTKGEIRHIGCWAHARRKFARGKALGKEHSPCAADKAISYIRQLYAN